MKTIEQTVAEELLRQGKEEAIDVRAMARALRRRELLEQYARVKEPEAVEDAGQTEEELERLIREGRAAQKDKLRQVVQACMTDYRGTVLAAAFGKPQRRSN